MGLGLNLVVKYYWRRAKRQFSSWAAGLRATLTRLI